ncbi:MAG: hypothetical protein ABI904_18135 [Chloroflexota bacterium]
MKRIAALTFAIVIFLSACASPATSTSAPAVTIESTSTTQPATITPVDNTATATFTPEPTSTSTPVPPSPHWYWSVDSVTLKVIAVNQFGDRKKIGTLDNPDSLHTASISLDAERALLFLDDNNTLRVYLLTLNGMQKIKLPSEPAYFNTEFSQSGRVVVAVHADFAVFTYPTVGAEQSQTVGAVASGPVFLVDLKSLTASLIDKEGNRDPLDVNRAWFRTSQDGRYLRYINGNPDADKMEIRELDLVTGKARTIYTTQGSPSRIYPAPEGDLWYLGKANIILDLNGHQTDFTNDVKMFTPLKDGKGVVYPWNCVDNCEIKVFEPFGNAAALTYNLPWTIDGASSYVKVRQYLPDQSLLFAGLPYAMLSKAPAIVKTYPDLKKEDIPLFRLTPDGKSRLVGIYVEGDLTSNVSADGRFILMQSIDKTSFFLYDAVTDRSLFSMPINTELEKPLTTVKFFDNGALVNLSAAVPGTKNSVYRIFYAAYSYKTSTTQTWEDVNSEISSCPDLLEDGTLVCWFGRTDGTNNYDLVHLDTATGIKTTLLENIWLIDSTP